MWLALFWGGDNLRNGGELVQPLLAIMRILRGGFQPKNNGLGGQKENWLVEKFWPGW